MWWRRRSLASQILVRGAYETCVPNRCSAVQDVRFRAPLDRGDHERGLHCEDPRAPGVAEREGAGRATPRASAAGALVRGLLRKEQRRGRTVGPLWGGVPCSPQVAENGGCRDAAPAD